MSKRKPNEPRPNRPKSEARATAREPAPPFLQPKPSASPQEPAASSYGAFRETVESIAIAFVLAFLFRTFEAEAFVIPTGSMAPTLMGQHKDLACPKCGYEFQLNASEGTDANHGGRRPPMSATCLMCGYPIDLRNDNPDGRSYPSFSGDRILVAKFPYAFHEPQRWDVIVFKFPGDANTNFIKRLVGLPGETVGIRYGDLWISKEGGEKQIARKLPEKLLAMLQPVFDTDLTPKITALGWPQRWRSEPPEDRAGAWTTDDGTVFQTDGSASDPAWLRYQHLIPTEQNWRDIARWGRLAQGDQVRPMLVSDFVPYNSGMGDGNPHSPGFRWVGDLVLECQLEARSGSGEAVLELVKGGRGFRCRIDLSDGTATLGVEGNHAADFHPKAQTRVQGPGRHSIRFANVDDELRLWVDGSVVQFDGPTTYDSEKLGTHVPTERDLSPVGISSHKAAVKISHVKLLRDIYYIADKLATQPGGAKIPWGEYAHGVPDLSNPARWDVDFAPDNMHSVSIELAAPNASDPGSDQFFVLGDNSAQSKDGRLWKDGTETSADPYVRRELLIGKALFIYWPHAFRSVGDGRHWIPAIPKVSRWQLVR